MKILITYMDDTTEITEVIKNSIPETAAAKSRETGKRVWSAEVLEW